MNLRALVSPAYLCATIFLFFIAAAHSQALVEAGVPAFGREWSGLGLPTHRRDPSSGKVPLPTLADPEGRAFLKRLTSTENLSFARDSHLPINARGDDFGKLMQGSSTIIMQYVTAANKGAKVHTETVMQMCFTLRLAEAGIVLVDEFIPTIAKDDKYEVRLAGLKKMYSGLTSIFVGAETSLGETSFYSPEDLSLLLQAMEEVLPTVRKAFPAGYDLELRKKLEARQAGFPAEKDAANLQKMIAELGS